MMANSYKGFPDPSLVLSVEEARDLLKSKDVNFIDTRNYWKYAKSVTVRVQFGALRIPLG